MQRYTMATRKRGCQTSLNQMGHNSFFTERTVVPIDFSSISENRMKLPNKARTHNKIA